MGQALPDRNPARAMCLFVREPFFIRNSGIRIHSQFVEKGR
jgi:hypothetical protein